MSNGEDATNQTGNQKQILVSVKSQPVNAKLHLDAKLLNEENAHSNFEVSTHERYDELPERSIHSDSKAEIPNVETRIEPRLSKYVRRHHPTKQIIGNKDVKPMTRNILRNESCLLS